MAFEGWWFTLNVLFFPLILANNNWSVIVLFYNKYMGLLPVSCIEATSQVPASSSNDYDNYNEDNCILELPVVNINDVLVTTLYAQLVEYTIF